MAGHQMIAAALLSSFCIASGAGFDAAFADQQDHCSVAAKLDSASVRAASTAELLELLTDDCIDELNNQSGGADKLSLVQQEISRRQPTRELLDAFRSASGLWSPYVIFDLVQALKDTEVEKELKHLAGQDTGLVSYLALRHFAERGDEWALKILNDHYFGYPVSSAEWAGIAALFGRYRYRPAADNLAHSVDAASLNLGGAAHESLCILFPEAAEEAKKLKTPETAQAFWIGYVGKQKVQGAP
jgi:hypothetical protein